MSQPAGWPARWRSPYDVAARRSGGASATSSRRSGRLPALGPEPSNWWSTDTVSPSRRTTSLAIANTSTFGGGMRVAPTADAADGWLDLVTVGAVSRGQLFHLLAHARTGGHVGRPGVAIRRARRVEAAG